MSNEILTPELKAELERQEYVHIREVPGRGVCGLHRFVFTMGLCWGLDEGGYRGRYCYEHGWNAMMALHHWDGTSDPGENWIKYKGEGGERSNENYHQ